jgi:hypothetical protein
MKKFVFFIIIILILFTIYYIITKNTKINIKYVYNNIETPKNNLPKIIFMYWHEKDITNELVKYNIESIRNRLPKDFKLIVYNDDTIKTELTQEEYEIKNKSVIQHYSDIIRIKLLKKYGGTWMDSSIMVKDFTFLETIYNTYDKRPFDVFMYISAVFNGGNKISEQHFENYFIVAPLNSIFINDLFNELLKAHSIGLLNYKIDLINKNINLKNVFSRPSDVYAICYGIIRKLNNEKRYNIAYDYADSSMYKYNISCNWDTQCIIDKYLKNKNKNDIYAVKIINNERQYINYVYKDKIKTTFF